MVISRAQLVLDSSHIFCHPLQERLDFSCAMFGPDGGLVANAPHIPVHLGSMQETVQYQVEINVLCLHLIGLRYFVGICQFYRDSTWRDIILPRFALWEMI